MRQPKRITIVIDTANAAFDDCEQGEVSRILRQLCRELAHGIPPTSERRLKDINGNAIGRVETETLRDQQDTIKPESPGPAEYDCRGW